MKNTALLSVALFAASSFAASNTTKAVNASTPAAMPVTAPAASLPTTSAAAATEATVPAQSGFDGALGLRPTLRVENGAFNETENTVELGYRFNPSLKAQYVQGFVTKGPAVTADDSFARLIVGDLWTNGKGLSLNYQPRLYLPTKPSRAAKGMVLAFRNYFTLSQTLGSRVTVSLSEIPILQAYNAAGTVQNGEPVANPLFENRVYLTTDVAITDKLSLSVPVMFHQTRNMNYQAAARRNNDWASYLWINPELMYAVSSNFTLGLSYYSDNMMGDDFTISSSTLSDGLNKGATQVVFRASL